MPSRRSAAAPRSPCRRRTGAPGARARPRPRARRRPPPPPAAAGRRAHASCVQPALGLRAAGPAAVATGAGLRAVRAADRLVALVVQWVVGQVVLDDVTPHVALGPVGERVGLPQA